MNDLSLTKYLTENVRNRIRLRDGINGQLANRFSNQIMVEGYTKKGPPDFTRIDWYVKPERNWTDYLTSPE